MSDVRHSVPAPAPRHPCPARPRSHGQALPILHEIRAALARLIATGETARIDLRALPFGPGDLDQLLACLGTGEVTAAVTALGPTEIRETGIAGVWLVDYRNAESQPLALQVEIATVPEILCPAPPDLAAALATLDARLDAARTAPPDSPLEPGGIDAHPQTS